MLKFVDAIEAGFDAMLNEYEYTTKQLPDGNIIVYRGKEKIFTWRPTSKPEDQILRLIEKIS